MLLKIKLSKLVANKKVIKPVLLLSTECFWTITTKRELSKKLNPKTVQAHVTGLKGILVKTGFVTISEKFKI